MEFSKAFENIQNYYMLGVYAAILILFFRNRASLFHILWVRLFDKNFAIYNRKLQKTFKDQLDLEKYRIIFPKFSLKSIYQATALVKWCDKNRIGYEQASFFSKEITYSEYAEEKITFELPSFIKIDLYFTQATSLIVLILIGMLCYSISISGLNDKILAFGKTSRTYFWIKDNQTLEGAFTGSRNWEISSSCEPNKITMPQLTEKEFISACSLIKSTESLESYFQKSRKEALITFAVLFPTLLVFLLFSSLSTKRIREKIKFSEHLKKSQEHKKLIAE